MNLRITSRTLAGQVEVPASKSIMHRALICAALADGVSLLKHMYFSKDILVTMDCLRALGAIITVDGDEITVQGIANPPKSATLDCHESGSTLRFMIPIAAALGVDATFIGCGKLVTRPLSIYTDTLPAHNIDFDYNGMLPCRTTGQLSGGEFQIQGNVSSQFITGLLFVLPLLATDSVLTILPPFESKSYVNITIDCLKSFGVEVTESDHCYHIRGGQQYKPCQYTVESDYSQAAFFLVASTMGSNLSISTFAPPSVQGDAKILSILADCGFELVSTDKNLTVKRNYLTEKKENLCVKEKYLTAFNITAEDIPDLVPILCVLGATLPTASTIGRVERLKIKESDRIQSTTDLLVNLGGQMSYQDDLITIHPATLHGGTVDCQNDHRIAMAAAIASIICDQPVTLIGADCVNKSYPTFWAEFKRLGGQYDVIDLD